MTQPSRHWLSKLLTPLSAALLLAACGTTRDAPSAYYHCDRNGEREQRAACD
ncbi:MAG: hypothetical protein M3O01_07370 [Pseudomonadota bacterium]|nr:hypothetical protein [Pseudomonadota bacterium]